MLFVFSLSPGLLVSSSQAMCFPKNSPLQRAANAAVLADAPEMDGDEQGRHQR
jgi:hypothetical protein